MLHLSYQTSLLSFQTLPLCTPLSLPDYRHKKPTTTKPTVIAGEFIVNILDDVPYRVIRFVSVKHIAIYNRDMFYLYPYNSTQSSQEILLQNQKHLLQSQKHESLHHPKTSS